MNIYEERCQAARERMAREGLDYLFIAPSSDMLYFIGYEGHITERLTLFVLPAVGEPFLVLPAFEAHRLQSLATFFSLRTWQETEDPYHTLREALPGAGQRPLRVGISDREWAVFLLRLQEYMPRTSFVPASLVVTPLRICKRLEEIQLLRDVSRFADVAFTELITTGMCGLMERQVSDRLAGLIRKAGHDSVAYSTVASGPHSASPHHTTGDRVIQEGDVVLLDFGGRYRGYYSDVSRTVVVGHVPEEFEKVYIVVRGAQQAAIDAVRPGVPAGHIDAVARQYITEAGYGPYFTHRVGHGIGLDDHEPPYLSSDNQQPLEVGMCFSVEPGIYLPGRFGVRIEDTVLVTSSGGERLNECTREITVVA